MRFMKRCFALLWATAWLLAVPPGTGSAHEAGTPFPAYGTGPIAMRLYTDYFCPPCRTVEPDLEPALEEMMNKGLLQITFVDTPVHKPSPLYARYFLYALKTKNDFHHALRVRRLLFAAAEKNITDEDKLKAFLTEQGIATMPFDVTTVNKRYNEWIKTDRINGTPICVIVREGKKETLVGGPDILEGLKKAQR